MSSGAENLEDNEEDCQSQDSHYSYISDDGDVVVDLPALNREESDNVALMVPEGSYNMLDYMEMIPMMNQIINSVSRMYGISKDDASILLTLMKWNKSKLSDHYFEITETTDILNVTKVRAIAMLSHPNYKWNKSKLITDYQENMESVNRIVKLCPQKETVSIDTTPPETIFCYICQDPEAPFEQTIGMSCNHNFCR